VSRRRSILARLAAGVLGVWALAGPALAAASLGPPLPGATLPVFAAEPATADLNPLAVLDAAGRALDAWRAQGGGVPAPDARAEPSRGPAGLATPLAILLLLTVITLVPSIMLMTTCFVRFIIVLGLVKQALGAQTIPPPQVLLALALFMTLLVMKPTIERIENEAIAPYQRGEIRDVGVLWDRASAPVRDFMFAQIEAADNWSSLYMILNYRGVDTSDPSAITREQVDTVSLVPAYMLSELKIAFLMGFKVYLPFLVIDMVVSSLLISMGMMMLPPVLISLPFKLLLFVLVDGWQLVVGSLLTSVAPAATQTALLLPPGLTPWPVPA
jgi:flagellar biosynthetic protein FliP